MWKFQLRLQPRTPCNTRVNKSFLTTKRAGHMKICPALRIASLDFYHVFRCFLIKAQTGFEPVIRVLQTHALPLGYCAKSKKVHNIPYSDDV